MTSEQQVLMIASWLLGLLAIASVAVLVGGRMTEQTRRVELLKAVGSTPGLVATILLAAVNALLITRATVIDVRHSSALARAHALVLVIPGCLARGKDVSRGIG